jgi:uncharacterized repeat protein (TIGR01451 family)
MNTTKHRPSVLAVLIMALGLITFATSSAHAQLAAGTTISNRASVSYLESADAVQSNEVQITVNLISGLAWLDGTLSPVTDTVGNGGAVSYTVDLHNTGNGTTTVSISDGTSQVAASLGAGIWSITPNNPALFGTVSSAAGVYDGGGNTTTIPVSYLDTDALTAGTTRVMIGATIYIVAAGSTASQLVVTGNATVAGAGVQIGEVRGITFSGTAGTLQGGDLDENHLHSMIATDDAGSGLNADGNTAATDTISSNGNNGAGTPWTTRVVAGALTVTKYSRNTTTPIVGATSISYDGQTYYQTGVRGNSGASPDTLEYLVVIANAGPGSATEVVMTDEISGFLTLTTTSVDIDTNGNGTFDVTDAVNNNAASVSGATLTVYAGTGGNVTTTTGGTIIAPLAPATTVVTAIRYRAVIK